MATNNTIIRVAEGHYIEEDEGLIVIPDHRQVRIPWSMLKASLQRKHDKDGRQNNGRNRIENQSTPFRRRNGLLRRR